MVTLNARFDGKVIVPDEPTGLAPGARVRVTLEPMDKQGPAAPGKSAKELLGQLPLIRIVSADAEAINRDPEFDIENAKLECFIRHASLEVPR